MATTHVLHPTVKAQVADEKLPAQEVVLNLTTGGSSTATVILHESQQATGDNAQAVDALSLNHTSRIGALQNTLFQARTTPDSQIVITDDRGHTLTFKGYLGNPSYRAGSGSLGNVRMVLHESVRLSGYRGMIYAPDVNAREGAGANTDGTMPFMDFSSTSMSVRFMEVLDFQIKYWVSRGAVNETPFSKEVKAAWHALNTTLYPDLKKVMNASNDSTTWEEFKGIPDEDNNRISGFMRDVITQQSNNFFGNFGLFQNGFQCQFVPGFAANGPLGYFIGWKEMTTVDPTALTLPVKSISISGGDKRFLPVTHVFVGGSMDSCWRVGAGGGQGNIPAPVLVAWPETPYVGGQVLHDSGPPWLAQVSPGDSSQFEAQEGQGLSLDQYRSGRTAVNKFIGNLIDTKKAPILKRWARNLYALTALQNSSTTFTIPLDVSILPGKRYGVFDTFDNYLFAGFLDQVQHTIQTQGKEGDATTTLTFTHVEAGSFILPNK